MSVDVKKIGLYIQKLRKKKGLTQNQLGGRLSISYQAVSKWERGETLPDTMLLLDLASILETTADNILNGGERVMDYTKKIHTRDIKKGIENLASVGELIGKDNTIYTAMVEGINTRMNMDVEDYFYDSYKREGLIAEVIVQNLMNGAYIDVSDAESCLEHEHWKKVIIKYAEKYGIK